MSAAKVTAKLRQVGHVAMLDGGRDAPQTA
jgi:hypothetical protein